MTQTVPAPSLPPDLVHLLETYCIGRKLGGGSFGTVRGSSELLCGIEHSTVLNAMAQPKGAIAAHMCSVTRA
jgi:hypothetical protein